MTEAEWLGSKTCNPAYVMDSLRTLGYFSERQLRLFLCGCSRLRCPDSPDEPTRRAWDIAERFADDHASADEAAVGRRDVLECFRELQPQQGTQEEPTSRYWELSPRVDAASIMVQAFRAPGTYWEVQPYYRDSNLFEHTELYNSVFPAFIAFSNDEEGEAPEPMSVLREIVGNPFRSITVDPSWLTPTVIRLAEHIYQERAFDQMPILADALEDADCDNADILNHCRSEGPHVRGCWVVDLLTGRK